MHHDNIEALRQEAIRITQLEINILQQMIEQGILGEANNDFKEEKTFDTASAPKTIEILEGEQYKLQNLDMVLAIVGTMKAGKSTTINAIVGTEILPNRNAPMTAIPTLIRHTKGQIEPKLVFDNSQPLNDLMQLLHQQIIKPDYQIAIKELESDRDLYSLIEKIRQQKPIDHEAVGEFAIFDFLKSVNDLVRISPILGINFPFSDYDEIHELPIIEIEFTHLKEMESAKGRLILLDTPGPNEAGQAHLRPMLQDQLKKASAVLAVMDYTQLKSDADAQIRAELKSIAKTAEGRIYALVNKFDQKDRNGMHEIEVKQFVEGLVDKQIKVEKIFPVSSKRAYLSNRARHEIMLNGKLPNPKDHPWVDDFFDEAGIRKKFQDDYEHIQEALEELWTDSNFSNPLENVIKVAFDNAALLALSSATDKSVESAYKINNFLSVTETALSKSTDELQALVHNIQADIQCVSDCEDTANTIIKQHVNAIHVQIEETIALLKNKNRLTFEDYFEHGVTKQHELAKIFEEKIKHLSDSFAYNLGKRFRGIFEGRGSSESDNSSNQNQPPEKKVPKDRIISFSDNLAEAQKFVLSIDTWINDEINKTKLDIESILEQVLIQFEESYTKDVITLSTDTLEGLKSTLNTAGFTGLRLELPSANLLKLDINIAGLTSYTIQTENYSRTRYRESDSFGAGAKRFFGGLFDQDEWGRDKYQEKVNEYKVDFNKMQNLTNERLDLFFANINENINNNISDPIEKSSTDFFTAFKKIVENIRADLIKSLDDKQQDQYSQDELLQKIQTIKQHVPSLIQDTEVLKKSITQHT